MIGLAVVAGVALQGWNLVWQDEFNVDGRPDPAKWGYEVGYIRNNELQYYTDNRPENVRVENGNLVIECRKDNFQEKPITSGSINTLGKAGWTYGRIEVRAKIPTGLGSWPAIWMMGVDRAKLGWPLCGEIDIMENVGFQPDNVFATVHFPTGVRREHKSIGGKKVASRPYHDFHIYAVEWLPNRLDFFYDGEKYFSYENDGRHLGWRFNKECYLLLNLAFGGTWGASKGVDEKVLPLKYLVDYVRVYQRS
ncbi:MAG: hypothetical protein BGO01_05025 [Armatimonadetes bacterium 55-13]|nr:glycoside hydrolase family 16 protein [Armatimonadota bacterium]OJU61449.1 MAG: hypothetical protein BGO01_05025 [Armatimonadetes bacterium 55-13]